MRKMLALLLLILLFVQLFPAAVAVAGQSGAVKNVQQSSTPATPLRKQDVLAMLKAGLSPEVVAAKINISSCDFDTSPEALEELKAAGVPDTVLLAMIKAAGRVQPPAQVEVRVPDATLVDIEAAHTISSADVVQNSPLSFRVARPVIINGVTVIAAGALATGRVVKVKRAGYWGRAGRLVWTMESVEAVDGKLLRLQPETGGQRGVSREGEVATKTAVTGVLLIPVFPLAPLALLHGYKRGENAVLAAGTRYTVFVRGETIINVVAGR